MGIRKAWKITREKSREFLSLLTMRQRIINIVFLFIALAMGIHLKLTVWDILTLLIFTGVILNPVSSKIIAIPALFLLIFSPLALIFKKIYLSEQLAIYAYYFLILAVIMGIYELKKDSQQKKES